jgi:hypothetical protein
MSEESTMSKENPIIDRAKLNNGLAEVKLYQDGKICFTIYDEERNYVIEQAYLTGRGSGIHKDVIVRPVGG